MLRRLFKFLRLSKDEKALIIIIIYHYIKTKLIFRLLPYKLSKRILLGKDLPPLGSRVPPLPLDSILKMFTRVLPALPGKKTCLLESLLLKTLLHRFGYSADLRFGVSLEDQTFKAHAWLEGSSCFLPPDPLSIKYTPLRPSKQSS